MLLNYANFPNIDPGLLNDFMKPGNSLFFVGHDVNVPATVNALRRGGRQRGVCSMCRLWDPEIIHTVHA